MDVTALKSLRGFTLLELVVIIIIVGILSVTVAIQWPTYTLNVSAQAAQLENNVRLTQNLSMTQDTRFCLVLGTSSYQIINSATSAAITLTQGTNTVNLGTGISFGTMVPSGMKALIFDGAGSPYSSTSATCTTATATAATALSANASIPLTASSLTRTVVVSPQTGSVTTQ